MAKRKGINSRAKGSTFERQIAKQITDWTGVKFRRTPQSGGWNKSGDITPLEPKDMVTWPFNLELKKRESWNISELLTSKYKKTGIRSWWKQSVDDAKTSNKIPILIFSKNFDSIYVCMRYDTFKTIKAHKHTRNFLKYKNLVFFLFDDLLTIKYKKIIKLLEG